MKVWALFILFLTWVGSAGAVDCVSLPDSTADVLHCKISLDGYPRPVHLYVPTQLDASKSIQLFVHFHGHNLDGHSHFDKRWGDYGQYLSNTKANAILAIPESVGNCTTYDQFFADQKRADQFFSALENKLELTDANLILSGHSGAYRVLNRLMSYANSQDEYLGHVRALGMFDATYGAIPEITKYIQTNNILFYDAFVTGPQATTEDLSRALMKQLRGDNVFFVPVKGESNESLLDQHFMTLKRGSLEIFWKKMAP